jgi:pimeloyl-ACP methyl ester carboxylesterase
MARDPGTFFAMTAPIANERDFTVETAPEIRVRGHILDFSSDPVGVFLHGFRSDCDGSKAIALAQHAEHRGYSWVRFDLSGHGRSDGDFTTFTITDAVRDVLAVLEALAPRPVVLVGSSLGGWLSVLAAQHAPQQVRAMLLIAPAFNFVQNFLAALPAEELRRWARQGIRRFSDPYQATTYTLGFEIVHGLHRYDVLSEPVRLECPLTILHGDQDEILPLANTMRFADRAHAPALRVEVVAGGDHRLTSAIPCMRGELDRIWETTTES